MLDSHPCVPHCRPWCGPKKRLVEVEELSKSLATRIAARGSVDKTRYILFFLVLDRDVFYGSRSSESGKTRVFWVVSMLIDGVYQIIEDQPSLT